MGLFSFFKKKQIDTNVLESGIQLEKTDPDCKVEFIDDTKLDTPDINNDLTDSEETNSIKTQKGITENIQDTIIYEEMEDYDPTKDLSNFCFPSADLLKSPEQIPTETEQINSNKKTIISILESNKIEISSIEVTVGYVNTVYEFVPKAGSRLSKIKQLDEDLAFALLVPKLSIEPVFERGTIAIIVPNKDCQVLSLQVILNSKDFIESDFELPLIIGRTMSVNNFIIDLIKQPHILIAGATGQGKSVLLNVMITSLLYKKHPAELKLILIDTHIIEFNQYSFLEKYYLAKLPDNQKAVISNVSIAVKTFQSICKEMDDRYELLQSASTRNINEYNKEFKKRRLNPLKGHRYLPYLVVVIDEYYDLIRSAGKEVEQSILRLTQKAQIVGIHIILATQRPAKNIIPEELKSNFPVRIAFSVASSGESKLIIDKSGAENLLGKGDALYCEGISTTRIQVPYISTEEVENIVEFITSQKGYSHAYELPEYINPHEVYISSIDLSDKDPLFEETARLIVIYQQGSTSLIQRKFSIGYNRAGRLMDQLESAGIVGPAKGSEPRDVFILDEYSLELKLRNL